eukprot:SAG31_NODE_5218_length_2669_cov_2.345136_4_plen_281_part_00
MRRRARGHGLLAIAAMLLQCTVTRAASSCATVGEANGYSVCMETSCVGVKASCVGDYAVSCSCGDNPSNWQRGQCSDPGGKNCAAEAAKWCDSTTGCHAFAINGGAYQGFPITCSPYGGLGGTMHGLCESVPSPDWVSFIKLPRSRWGDIFLLVCLVVSALYLGGGMVYMHRVMGKRGWEALPHRDSWTALAGLTWDGVQLVNARVLGRKDGAAIPPSKESEATILKKEKRASKRDKSRDAAFKAPKKSASSSNDSSETSLTPPLSNAASGGGRWVHVPN